MKTFKWFIVAASLVAFISCSSAYPETIDEETLEDLQSRGETTQNDTTGSDARVTITGWIKITEGIEVKEDPKQEVPNDSIPNDSIPSDSTKNEQAFKLK